MDKLSAVDQSPDPGSGSLRNPNTRLTPFFILRAIVVRLSRGGLTQDTVGSPERRLRGQSDRTHAASIRLLGLFRRARGGRASRARGGAPFLSTARDPGEHLFPGARCEQEGSRCLTPFLFAAAPAIPFGERVETAKRRDGPEGAPRTPGFRSRPKVLVGISTGRRRYGRDPAWAPLSDRHLGLHLVGLGLPAPAPRCDSACALADLAFSTARRRVGGKAAWGAWWVWLVTVGLCF